MTLIYEAASCLVGDEGARLYPPEKGPACGEPRHQGCGTSNPRVPDLEVVDVPRESSFKAWAHGYPFRTVRWHFHPEYEIIW